ncbi:hypothetical protein SAMD00019534_081190 [Acytostelium subglobosum LB1]|uniref:hypothetical protein n=1 Tax=Acytostelium subglobosum LB1 TaxID=1410327 RepID=UPI000644F2B5|nr:hypothetical protein SAMD00019534_081190 [Acytostelium subglobosum LB1]GAM24944.1 hypothetical protein SAMD00019534_081190 [Acytostelium subglobosum LB1]|eukprot:XP_012752033.1 hypothetical protein SAMD00019534_081190 [Acytostelium subglobosum LB1]
MSQVVSIPIPAAATTLHLHHHSIINDNTIIELYPIKKVPKNPIGRPKSKRVGYCFLCKTTNTPEWRKGENGQDVCNACGLRQRKERRNRLMPHNTVGNIINPNLPTLSTNVAGQHSSNTHTIPIQFQTFTLYYGDSPKLASTPYSNLNTTTYFLDNGHTSNLNPII